MTIALVLTGGPAKDVGVIMAKKRSRSLLKLPGKTLLEHIVGSLKNTVDKIIVAYDDPLVASKCSDTDCIPVYVRSRSAVDAICATLGRVKPSSDEDIVVVYGDVYSEASFYKDHAVQSMGSQSILLTVVRPLVVRGGYLRLDIDEEGNITTIGEGEYVFAGIFSAKARWLEELCRLKNLEKFLALKNVRGRLETRIWPLTWIDVDTPWDYMVVVRYELQRLRGIHVDAEAKVSERAELEPPVYIEAGVRVDSNAVIRGPVYIEHGSLIGAHSFIRAETMVSANAIVGAYSEVKRSIVCRSARIGSHSYIADSIVGEEAELAPYTVTVNTPYRELGDNMKVLMTTTYLPERLKVGAIIAAAKKTRPHEVLEPGQVYTS